MRTKIFTGCSAAVAFLSIAFWLPICVQAADWPHWRGPDRDGISKETGWSTTWANGAPKQLWKASIGTGFSSFAVSQGRAYAMGNNNDQDTVFCFDAATGKEIWKHSYAAKLDPKYYEGGPSATPTVDGDRVYTLSKQGMFHCLDAKSGSVVWAKNLTAELALKIPEWGFASSVMAEGDRLYLNVGKQGVAFDKTGKVIWTTGTEASGYSTFLPFTMGGRKGFALFAAKSVVAVDPQDGKTIWEYPWKTDYDVNAADPIIQDDMVFISSGYNRGASVIRIQGATGTKVWENKSMRNHFNSCLLINGFLYGFDEGELKCLDFKTGAVKWAEKSTGKGALTAADGKLIVLSEKGELMVAPAVPDAFKPVARAQILGGKCWTTPVLSNGRLYARNAKGDAVCVELR